MCIAILKTVGNPISEEILHNCWVANDDGAGFAYINWEGNIEIYKTLSWEDFINAYNDAFTEFGEVSNFLIHFRITSRGSTDITNCHPFMINDDAAIIHNGTITNIKIDTLDTRSDTKIFAEEYLSLLPKDWEDNPIIAEFIEDYIGYSKIVMLHKTKGYFIYNEKSGHWFEGNWYSNDSYKPRKYNGFFNTCNNGYWDHETQRWISVTEVKNKNKYKKELPVLVKCDQCSKLTDIQKLIDVQLASGVTEYWCEDCWETFLVTSQECNHCQNLVDEKELKEYYDIVNLNYLVLCDACAETLITNGSRLELITDDGGAFC